VALYWRNTRRSSIGFYIQLPKLLEPRLHVSLQLIAPEPHNSFITSLPLRRTLEHWRRPSEYCITYCHCLNPQHHELSLLLDRKRICNRPKPQPPIYTTCWSSLKKQRYSRCDRGTTTKAIICSSFVVFPTWLPRPIQRSRTYVVG
jgi:hypothetical protein